MTITRFEGVPVVRDELAPSHLPPRADGTKILFKRVHKLTLANDRVIYCDDRYEFFSDKIGQVTAHLSKRDGRRVGRPSVASISAPVAPVTKLLKLIEENKKLKRERSQITRQRDTWKKRAMDAERALTSINRAIEKV